MLFELIEACRNAFCRELAREAAAAGNRRSITVAVSVSTISAGNDKIRRRLRRLDDEVSWLILFLTGVASTPAAAARISLARFVDGRCAIIIVLLGWLDLLGCQNLTASVDRVSQINFEGLAVTLSPISDPRTPRQDEK